MNAQRPTLARSSLAAAALLAAALGTPRVPAQGTAPAPTPAPPLTPPPADTPRRPLPPVPERALCDTVAKEILEDARRRFPAVPAFAAVVVRDGRIVAEAVTGVRKAKDPTPVTTKDLFHLGTCTKALTATLIGVMIDEGSLRWDSTVLEVLGREVETIDSALAGVTVDQLLHHRSGMQGRGPLRVWDKAQRAKGTAVEQRTAYVSDMLALPPGEPPGEYEYSNAGYAVLARMAEVVAGKPYEDLMQEKVLKPLGITTAVFGQPGDGVSVQQPWPHLNGTPVFRDNPVCLNSAARLCMSMEDWARFANLHLGHQPTPPLLKPATLEALQAVPLTLAPDRMGYACGWFRPLRPWAEGRLLHHVGGNAITYCAIWLLPKQDMGVMVAVNEGSPVAGDATDYVVGSMLNAFGAIQPVPLDSARPREQQWPAAKNGQNRGKRVTGGAPPPQ